MFRWMAEMMSLATTPFSARRLASSQMRTLRFRKPLSEICPTPDTAWSFSVIW